MFTVEKCNSVAQRSTIMQTMFCFSDAFIPCYSQTFILATWILVNMFSFLVITWHMKDFRRRIIITGWKLQVSRAFSDPPGPSIQALNSSCYKHFARKHGNKTYDYSHLNIIAFHRAHYNPPQTKKDIAVHIGGFGGRFRGYVLGGCWSMSGRFSKGCRQACTCCLIHVWEVEKHIESQKILQ